MNNFAIIYHDADFDGKLSNEVCRYWLSRIHPDANIQSYGWDYGRPVPTVFDGCGGDAEDGTPTAWEDYDQIYIVDLSVDELMARADIRDKIVWIDHHKSAIDKWVQQGDKKYGFQFSGYRIDGVAACRLCWQWFTAGDDFPGRLPNKQEFIDRKVNEPLLIRLAGEYDIWDHRDPRAKELQFGLRQLHEFAVGSLAWLEFDGVKDSTDGDCSASLENCLVKGALIKGVLRPQQRCLRP